MSAVISACGGSCFKTWVCLETFGARYTDMRTGSHLCQGKHLCICMVGIWRRCSSNVFLLNTIEVLDPVFAPQCMLEPRALQALAPSQYSEMGQKRERNGVLEDKGAYQVFK